MNNNRWGISILMIMTVQFAFVVLWFVKIDKAISHTTTRIQSELSKQMSDEYITLDTRIDSLANLIKAGRK